MHEPEPRSLKPGTRFSEFNDSAEWFSQEVVNYDQPPVLPKARAFPNLIRVLLSLWRTLYLILFFGFVILLGIAFGLAVIAFSFEVQK